MKKKFLLLMVASMAVGAALLVYFLLAGAGGDVASEVGADGRPILAGRLVDSSANPVEGAFVFVGAAATRTGEDGRFFFQTLPAGEHEVDVSAEGYIRPGSGRLGRASVVVEAGHRVDDLELVLQRAASISGRVVAGEDPLFDASISLSYVFAQGLDNQQLKPFILSDLTTAKSDGSFTLDAIAPGRLQVLVESEAFSFAESHEIYLRPGQDLKDLVIDVAPAGGVRGVVVNEGGEPLQARVVISSADTRRNRSAMTDHSGAFRFRTLKAGRYTLRVEAEGYRTEILDDLVLQADEFIDRDVVLIAESLLRGLVVEPDGTTVPGATIQLFSGESQRRIRSDQEGRFRTDGASGQQWRVRAFSSQHDPSPLTSIRPGEEVVLELNPGGTILGEVVDARGRAVTGYDISVVFAETEANLVQARHIDELHFNDDRGRFEYGPLPSGRFRLRVDTPGYPTATTDPLTVRAGRTTGPVRIHLDQGATFEGVVVDAETADPVAGARLYHLASRGDSPVTTDNEGRFNFERLPAGLQSFRVAHQDYTTEIFSGISLTDGESVYHELELQPAGDGPLGFSFHGIGAALGRSPEGVAIVGLDAKSAGAAAGLQQGDLIRSVDGEAIDEMTLDQVIERIRGEGGVPVDIEVQRPGQGRLQIDVDRERVFIPRPTR